MRCTPSRANPRNGSIIFHDWTVPGTTESRSEDPTAELSDHSRTTIFLLERRVVFCQSRLLRAVVPVP